MSVTLIELLLGFAILDDNNQAAWRFLAASSTLCPSIALLGAKRPQDGPWQWIVGSLWLVLALPAIQHLMLQRSVAFEVHPARAWFLFVLLVIGATNSVFSRYGPAVLLFVAGQVVLLTPHLPAGVRWLPSVAPGWGLFGLTTAIVMAQISIRKRATTPALNRVWLDFRDAFGLVWSLRFMERMNTVAHTNGWNMTLQWSGFEASDGSPNWQLSPDQLRVLRQSFANLLRRFVSPEWIADRLDQAGDQQGLSAATE